MKGAHLLEIIKRSVPQSVRARIRQELLRPGFRKRCSALAGRPKIVYVLTPPPSLANIGDHAQVVAIRKWMQRHFPDRPVLEVDKKESVQYLDELARYIGPEDVIFIHSGGNLGDRGIMSESARRGIIQQFNANPIISLPQTIYFSDTEKGRRERDRSVAIYSEHPNLTVIGRDTESARLAEELFPNATTFAMPDFVLSLPVQANESTNRPRNVLFCLRNDDESILEPSKRVELANTLEFPSTLADTQHSGPIAVSEREKVLDDLLETFRAHDVVVTDRYHGAIFSVISSKPTVVLPTVDHKLTSAVDWFSAYKNVRMAATQDEIADAISEVCAADQSVSVDWNEEYFTPLAQRLKTDAFSNA